MSTSFFFLYSENAGACNLVTLVHGVSVHILGVGGGLPDLKIHRSILRDAETGRSKEERLLKAWSYHGHPKPI